MIMQTGKQILIIMLLFFMAACEKDVTIEMPNKANMIVLNSLIARDTAVYARLTLSQRVSSLWFPEVKNGVVKLLADGKEVATMDTITLNYRLYYTCNVKPAMGVTYRVTATVPGYETVYGEDLLPEEPVAGEVRYSGDYRESLVSVELKDPGGRRNYYRVRLYGWNEMTRPDGSKYGFRTTEPLFFETDNLDLGLFGNGAVNEYFTDDALFDGKNMRVLLPLENAHYNEIAVEVAALSETSFKYLQSAFLAKLKNDNALVEKVILYNNIQNGLGIVGGMTLREQRVKR